MDGHFQKDCKYPTYLVKGHRKKRRNAGLRDWPIQNVITPFFKKTYTLQRVDILLNTPWFSNAAAVCKTFRNEEGVASIFIILPPFLFKLLTVCSSLREFYFQCTRAAFFLVWPIARMKWGWQSQECSPLLAIAPTESEHFQYSHAQIWQLYIFMTEKAKLILIHNPPGKNKPTEGNGWLEERTWIHTCKGEGDKVAKKKVK